MNSEQAAETPDVPESLPLLEQLEQDKILSTEPVQCGPSTESLLNTASTLLANITATSLLPSTSLPSKLPELPLIPNMSVNSLLLAAASNDILSSLTSTLGSGLEPTSSELSPPTPPQPPGYTVTQASASTPTSHTMAPPANNLLASVQSLIQTGASLSSGGIKPPVAPSQPAHKPAADSQTAQPLTASQPLIVPDQPLQSSVASSQPVLLSAAGQPTQSSVAPSQQVPLTVTNSSIDSPPTLSPSRSTEQLTPVSQTVMAPAAPSQSSQSASLSIQPSVAPSLPKVLSVAPSQQVQPTVVPSQTIQPLIPSIQAMQPSTAPSQPLTASSQPLTASSQPSTASSQPLTASSQPSTASSQPSTAPSQPSTAPSLPLTAPSQPSTAPSLLVQQSLAPTQLMQISSTSSLAKSTPPPSSVGLVNSQPLSKPVQAVLLPKQSVTGLSSHPLSLSTTPALSSTPQIIKSSALTQIPLSVSRPKSSVVPARIGQVTAEILTNFQPPLSKSPITLTVKPMPPFKPVTEPNKITPPTNEAPPTKPTPQSAESKPLPQTRVSAGEILASVTGLAENRATRVGTPSLQANEQMLSEDESSDEEMDVQPSGQDHPLPVPGPPPDPPTSSRSDSPYADDDSFASFLAREVHETALEDGSSSSRSPTPSHSGDLHALVSHLQGQGSSGPGLRRFGVTASCPPAPVQLPDDAMAASLDMTSRNFPKRSKYAHRAAMSAMHPYNRTRGGGASVAKTLDLLKAVLQSSFNMEVKRLCDDYLHIFTQAAANIRDNTGDSVPEATLKLLVCKMLEEAQAGYVQGKWEFPYGKLPRSEKLMSPSGSPMSTKKLKLDKLETRYGPPKRVRKPPTDRTSDKSAVWKWGMDKRRLDPEKWEPEKMTLNTVFCLGVNVNKALGHAANRGKVYYLHPELFKYACDGDDKTWLYENKYLPVHGGKAFLMIYKEVAALVSTDDTYKEVSEIVSSVAKLQQFRVPQFMIDKMKTFMKSVQGYFAQEAGSNGPPVSKS